MMFSPFRGASRPRLSTISGLSRAFSTSPSSQVARFTLVGRLGADPEMTTTRDGGGVIKYVVGTSYGPKEKRHTSWFRIASFADKPGPAREKVMGLSKGTLVYLEGDASMRSYVDGDGKKHTQLSLVQTKVEVLKRVSPGATETPTEDE